MYSTYIDQDEGIPLSQTTTQGRPRYLWFWQVIPGGCLLASEAGTAANNHSEWNML